MLEVFKIAAGVSGQNLPGPIGFARQEAQRLMNSASMSNCTSLPRESAAKPRSVPARDGQA
jgi:hypothetical protein